jgi:DinB superfamily
MMMSSANQVQTLVDEYRRALDYTESLWRDLPADDVVWRPKDEFSPIGWHLGHQAAVAHFMVRNLTAAEPSPDPELDGLMDSATPEVNRVGLPSVGRLAAYRKAVAARVIFRVTNIAEGRVGAPAQLCVIAATLLVAVTNHEYQHSQWICEVRHKMLGHSLPARPRSAFLSELDGYLVLNHSAL